MKIVRFLIIKTLLLALIVGSISKVQAQTSKGLMKDSLALVAFYNSTQESRYWSGYRDWKDKPISRWYGVSLGKRGGEYRVTQLNMRGTFYNALEGELPAQLGNLEYLETLFLAFHNFSGGIPKEIGNLKNLKSLVLESNHLSGSVPGSIENLRELEMLSLFNNQLTGNPLAAISECKKLLSVFLNNNKFSGDLPVSLNNLSKLETFNIGHNNFKGNAVDALASCHKLHHLDLSDCSSMVTTPILANLDKFPSMENLDLDNTAINGPMPEITAVNSTMTYLDLDSTGLTGSIPESIKLLTALKEFYIANNKVDKLPDLTQLKEFGATDNLLQFDQLEKNVAIPFFHYSPQGNVGNKVTTTVRSGSTVRLNTNIGGEENVYQWRKDFRILANGNGKVLTIEDYSSEDAGVYAATVKNNLATKTTIRREPLMLEYVEREEIGNEFPITINGDIGLDEAQYQWSTGSRKKQITINSGDTIRLTISIGEDIVIEEEWIVEKPWHELPPKPDKIITFKNILFERGSTNLISGQDEIDKLAEMMLAYPDVRILVMGHTDNQGDPRRNQILSENRTKHIRDYLVHKGVKIYRIKVKGFGDTDPVASNLKESTRKLNRRVEFKVLLPDKDE